MATLTEASKEIQLDRINNKINFLNSEINRTINQMNNIYLEIDNEAETSSKYNGISMGNLNIKRREYDDKKNHLMSCITSLETQINKIPVQEEDYSQEFIENFLNEVKEIEKNKKEEDVYGEVIATDVASPSYIKTKSGLIVPKGKEPKMLRASATGYVCRAETFCKLLLRVINEYRTVYMYGSNGQRPSESLLRTLKAKFPDGYSSAQIAFIRTTYNKNYWAFDCSGFLRAVLWGWCGDDSKTYGGSCFGKGSIVPWHTSSSMIASCPHDPKDTHYNCRNLGGSCIFPNNIVPGECVWTTGHIGAYIGNGQCAEATPHWTRGAQVTILANISSASGNRRSWKRHGKLPYIDYSNTMTDNLGNGWIAGPGNGGSSTTSSSGAAQYGYINGLNVTDMYESDNYYGYGQKTEFIERTENASVVRLVVSESTTVSNLAKSLSMTTTNLLNLNPSLKNNTSSSSSAASSSKASSSSVVNSGTTIYIPASAYTAAKEKATSSYNTASAQIEQLNKLLSVIKGDSSLASYVTSMTALIPEVAEEPITAVNKMLTSSSSKASSSSNSAASSSSKTASSTNHATASSGTQTNSEKMHDYKGWTRVYDTGPYKDYADARIIIVKDGKTRVIRTVISPTGYNESYSNTVNLQQTTGGWFMARHGENPVNLTITGVMLDTDANPEKHAFIKEWKDYLRDKQGTRTGLFYNKSSVKIQLEGIRYEGVINSISFSKDANTPSLYNFTLNFSCVNYKITRSISGAVKRLGKKGSRSSSKASSSTAKISANTSSKTKAIGNTLYKTMNNK